MGTELKPVPAAPSQLPSFNLPSANSAVTLVRRPSGIPLPEDFAVSEIPMNDLRDGEIRVRNLYLSVDPVQRGWAADATLMPLGAVMRALAVGVIVETRHRAFAVSDLVYGYFGWQVYHNGTPEDVISHFPKPAVRPSLYAGVLGMPGVTAYLALMDLAPPKPGDLALVSTAAGVVGSVVGQLLKSRGADAIGLTGDDAKVQQCMTSYGYKLALNYKSAGLAEKLAHCAPQGFQIYFDNTGGPILDLAIRNMALYGRIVQCGTAATASWSPAPTGMRNEREILLRRLSWNGFVIFDHIRRFPDAIAVLEPMVIEGALHYEEDITPGLRSAASGLADVFSGKNRGKKLISIIQTLA